jgi:hypothetical protein
MYSFSRVKLVSRVSIYFTFNHKLCSVAIKTLKTEPVNLNQNFSRMDQNFVGNFDYFLIAITRFPVSTCIFALCISAIDDHTLCVLVQGHKGKETWPNFEIKLLKKFDPS